MTRKQDREFRIYRSIWNEATKVPPAWVGRSASSPEEAASKFGRALAEKEGYELIRAEGEPTPWSDQLLFSVALYVRPAYPDNQVPDCPGCGPGFHPDHYPNTYCKSGKRPHCTCDYCF